MSALKVARVLKKIKDECYKSDKRYPKYYAPFLDQPEDCDIFDLIKLFEELSKKQHNVDCQYEKTLYKYLLEDESKHTENSYIEKIEECLLKGSPAIGH